MLYCQVVRRLCQAKLELCVLEPHKTKPNQLVILVQATQTALRLECVLSPKLLVCQLYYGPPPTTRAPGLCHAVTSAPHTTTPRDQRPLTLQAANRKTQVPPASWRARCAHRHRGRVPPCPRGVMPDRVRRRSRADRPHPAARAVRIREGPTE
jgi:hypothetical protein